ncbi:MAG TPA: mannitol dehydrogenase family protein [Solirubrobacterales bacterium]|nr:mannitol dehydrogenase family protein [Solirubrobacterales bacterium]
MLAVSAGSRRSAEVRIPTYDRSALSPGVVHIGVGGFHRAHQGTYFDEIAEQRISDAWGVIGVGLRSSRQRPELLGQECEYAVLERSPDRDRVRVVGSLLDYLSAREEPAAVLAALADPQTKLVTITVTGEGYGPRLFGYLVEGLRLRREAGLPPFTVLSCDNLVRNGETVRRGVLEFASLRDARLAGWIEENVAFPCSVVDRITPEASEKDVRLLERKFGIEDRAPVVCEDFAQWIVEDRFCNERPPLEEVGVQLVADADAYEMAKKRLLNGGHSAIGYIGSLCGHERVDEAVTDPLLRRYLGSLMAEEITPLLPPTLGLDLSSYRRSLLKRFSNRGVGDRLSRLCGRGSVKMPAYLLPSLAEALEQGRPHGKLTLALAAWVRYLWGEDFAGDPIEIKDAMVDQLQPLARRAIDDPRPLLGLREVFGELGEDEGFATELQETLAMLQRRGPRAAVELSLAPDLAAVA